MLGWNPTAGLTVSVRGGTFTAGCWPTLDLWVVLELAASRDGPSGNAWGATQ